MKPVDWILSACSPLSNNNNRKVYKSQLRRNTMAKTLGSKLKTGALIGAGLIALAGAPKTEATTIDYINTVISGGSYGGAEDQDLTRDGIQLRYDWTVHNESGQAFTADALWDYTIQTDLESRGMYGFSNNNPSVGGTDWSYQNGEESSWLAELAGSIPIRPGNTRTFSAFIDANLVTGNEEVGSYGIAIGTTEPVKTNTVDVTVPIPEPTTMAILGVGALAALGIRRIKEDHRYR
jgi:hypothetical protein